MALVGRGGARRVHRAWVTGQVSVLCVHNTLIVCTLEMYIADLGWGRELKFEDLPAFHKSRQWLAARCRAPTSGAVLAEPMKQSVCTTDACLGVCAATQALHRRKMIVSIGRALEGIAQERLTLPAAQIAPSGS